jgi:hypothetical protein
VAGSGKRRQRIFRKSAGFFAGGVDKQVHALPITVFISARLSMFNLSDKGIR